MAVLICAQTFLSLPRSSNGRTAAFGAVNRGSNPCRGATTFLSQLHGGVLLTAAPPPLPPVSRTFRRFSTSPIFSVDRKICCLGQRQRCEFRFVGQNSPFSLVDRSRLLTGG